MSEFPQSATEFYRLRDDRTNRCTDNHNYQNAAVAVYVSSKTVLTLTGQVMLLVAANLLSRWCRKVAIIMPVIKAHPALGIGGGDLGELILAQMHDADPFGDFEIMASGEPAVQITLCIGSEALKKSTPETAFIDASGWLASISIEKPIGLPTSEDHNPLGAIAAACLGVAQVFKFAIGMSSEHYLREGILDMFQLEWSDNPSHTPWPTDLNVGKMLMVGAGSVGSSAAYCMRLGGLAGAISIVDRDDVKIENFNRSPVFGRRTTGFAKSQAVADFLNGSPLSATAVPVWWDEFVQQVNRSSFDFDVWLPVANEFDVRRAMQHSVPPLMIHASTTANWGVNHGRHIPGRDDCLADRFPTPVAPEDLTCATGEVKTTEAVIDAALPFASLFAGLLITADLVRALLPEYPHVPNFALFDWYGTLDTIQAWDRKARAGCICQEQGLGFHERFNSSTKYWQLFRFS